MMGRYTAKNDFHGCYEGEIIDGILSERRIPNPETFFHPGISELLPLDELPNIEEAYEKLDRHMQDKSRIAILADVDVDGISSATIMHKYLKDCGVGSEVFINSGKKHGLSIDEPYWDKLADFDLLLIVDSLNNGTEEYSRLAAHGTEMIVLDHHHVDSSAPYDEYVTLVTSQTSYRNKELSGAGVTWKFCKYCDEMNLTEYADDYLDLCACGLLADVTSMMSLENRYLVYEGLGNLKTPAIKKIIGRYAFDSTSVLFSVAPLINAANRLNYNQLALDTMLADNDKDASKQIKQLKDIKKLQDAKINELMESAEMDCEDQRDRNVITVVSDSEPGFSGLLATKICSKYGKPTLVLREDGDEYRGSLRSDDVDLMGLINGSGYGIAAGHEQAAGVSVKKSNLVPLMDYLEKFLEGHDATEAILVDAFIGLEDLTFHLARKAQEMDHVSGKMFEPIKFMIDGITDYEVSTLKDGQHLVIRPNQYVDLIKWNSTYEVQAFEDASIVGTPITVVGTINISNFRGVDKIQVICDEIGMEEW